MSRLDYYDMTIFTGEAYSRLDYNTGWFIKGYAGGGGLFGGRLKDEDFPPVIDAVFVDAERQQERLADLRQRRCRHQAGPRARFPCRRVRRLSFHARLRRRHGLHPDRDQSGHLRAGGIPDVHPRHLADQQLALAARSAWKASVEFDRRWKLTLDAAWLPYAALYGADSHLLRIGTNPGDFTGPIPEDGKGWGYQFDATVSYRFNDWSASAPAAATGTSRPRATPISRAAWSASTPSRRWCTGGPIISAASSRPTSSSVRTRLFFN